MIISLPLISWRTGFSFTTHGKIAHGLCGLDKTSAHIVVAYHAHFKGDARFCGIADGGVITGIWKRHNHVCPPQGLPGPDACRVPFSFHETFFAVNGRVGPGKIDIFKYAQ